MAKCGLCEIYKRELKIVRAQLEVLAERKGKRDSENITLQAHIAGLKANLRDIERRLEDKSAGSS